MSDIDIIILKYIWKVKKLKFITFNCISKVTQLVVELRITLESFDRKAVYFHYTGVIPW